MRKPHCAGVLDVPMMGLGARVAMAAGHGVWEVFPRQHGVERKLCRERAGTDHGARGRDVAKSNGALAVVQVAEGVLGLRRKERSGEVMHPVKEYKMNHKKRGLALIFNHEEFHGLLGLRRRGGTCIDRDNLYSRLVELGFEVKYYDNLKAKEVMCKMYEASTASHIDADCFLCVFLTHGEGNHIYAYDAMVEISMLTDFFKGDRCKSLVGKPKIFIIQACRGDKHDEAVQPMEQVDATRHPDSNETQVDSASVYTLPAGADFLMCYSVAEGYFSYRNTDSGSWYIQDLCEVLRRYGRTLEITELLTLVNMRVSQREVDIVDIDKEKDAKIKKQIPCFASMLTKKLHFQHSDTQ
ncbi:caspase-6-like [Sorex araneus]|uniref:caspase-6-like n=1 Tax=Sorex araneus TaxID=42254 RepID=UPI0024333FDB|nr:caspase-6-like [Sorex araneus]